jgi:hypothetical protein
MATAIHKTTFEYKPRISPSAVSDGNWLVNYDFSHMDGIPKKFWITENDAIREMTEEEKFEKDNSTLEQYKTQRYQEIDAKTASLIYEGFYHNGKRFSLSQEAQFNWNSMVTMAQGGVLSFPARVSTRFDADEYYIQDISELMLFVGTAFAQVEKFITTGRRLKIAIGNANTYAKASSLQDMRTVDCTVEQLDSYIDAVTDDGDSGMEDE